MTRRRPTLGCPTGLRAGVLAAIACLTAGPATAQVLQGTVVDADRDVAIDGAIVLLVDSVGAVIDSTATDPDGRYRVTAPDPGSYMLHVARDGYLSYSTGIAAGPGAPVEHRVEMPVISNRAARVMNEVIQREAALQAPWGELCGEPVRPWEAGVLVGVTRNRTTMEPVPRTVVRLALDERAGSGADSAGATPAPGGEPGGHDTEPEPWPRTRIATETGAFWFCNVPMGRVRVVARADGYATDRFEADVRAGTISWYDVLLRPAR